MKDTLKFPVYFLALMWLIFAIEWVLPGNLSHFGILPRELAGLIGVAFSPLLHGSLFHLLSNSFPVVILGSMLAVFYKDNFWDVVIGIWILSGLGTWLIGRDNYHIGASGIIFGLMFFLFVSGIITKRIKALLAATVVFVLYGGTLIFGLLPTKVHVSFEGHIAGALSGIAIALLIAKYDSGSQKE